MSEAPFVETSVSCDIFKTIDLARQLGKNAAIVGRPGVGKTRALLAYANQYRCYLLTATAISQTASRHHAHRPPMAR